MGSDPPLERCPSSAWCKDRGREPQVDSPVCQGEPSSGAFTLCLHHGPHPRALTTDSQGGGHPKALGGGAGMFLQGEEV